MGYTYTKYAREDSIEGLIDAKNNLRYLLKIPLKNKAGKSVLVIMKNPSDGNHLVADHTLNNVLRVCYQQGYSLVYVMNLYAYQSKNPEVIGDLIKQNQESFAIGSKNDELLRIISRKVDEVIVGWGTNTFRCTVAYKKRIQAVARIIQDKPVYYVQGIDKQCWYPRHPQVWHTKSNLEIHPWKSPI